ncbi:MAG: hypothetical protein ACOH1V_14965 [Stenotrophomonas sp.]
MAFKGVLATHRDESNCLRVLCLDVHQRCKNARAVLRNSCFAQLERCAARKFISRCRVVVASGHWRVAHLIGACVRQVGKQPLKTKSRRFTVLSCKSGFLSGCRHTALHHMEVCAAKIAGDLQGDSARKKLHEDG